MLDRKFLTADVSPTVKFFYEGLCHFKKKRTILLAQAQLLGCIYKLNSLCSTV